MEDPTPVASAPKKTGDTPVRIVTVMVIVALFLAFLCVVGLKIYLDLEFAKEPVNEL